MTTDPTQKQAALKISRIMITGCTNGFVTKKQEETHLKSSIFHVASCPRSSCSSWFLSRFHFYPPRLIGWSVDWRFQDPSENYVDQFTVTSLIHRCPDCESRIAKSRLPTPDFRLSQHVFVLLVVVGYS